MTLEWDLPKKDTPGYAEQRHKLLGLLNVETSPEGIASVFQFLVQFVRGPISHDEALEAIGDLPLGEFARIVREVIDG